MIYEIVKEYDVVPNIRRAGIEAHEGWVILELTGPRGARRRDRVPRRTRLHRESHGRRRPRGLTLRRRRASTRSGRGSWPGDAGRDRCRDRRGCRAGSAGLGDGVRRAAARCVGPRRRRRPVPARSKRRSPPVTRAARRVGERLAALLATDPEEQRETPLEIVRTLYEEPTEILVAAGVPPVVRDAFDERAWPEDRYDLVPRTLGDLGDPDLGPLHLAWGMAKATVLRARAGRIAPLSRAFGGPNRSKFPQGGSSRAESCSRRHQQGESRSTRWEPRARRPVRERSVRRRARARSNPCSITSTRSPTWTSSRCRRRSACSAAPHRTGSSGSTGVARDHGPHRGTGPRQRLAPCRAPARPQARRRGPPGSLRRSARSHLQFRLIRSDGTVRHVRVRVVPAPSATVSRACSSARWKTSRRASTTSPPTRNGTGTDPFRSLVVASALGVVYSDVVGRVVYVNDRWLEICGVRADDILGTDDLRVAHPDDRDGDLRIHERRRGRGRRVVRSDAGAAARRRPCVTRARAWRRSGTSTGRSAATSARSRTSPTKPSVRTAAEVTLQDPGRGRGAGRRDVTHARDRVGRGRRRTGHQRPRTVGPVRRRRLGRPRRADERGRAGPGAAARLAQPRSRCAAAGHRCRLAHRDRRGDRLRHVVLAPGTAIRFPRRAGAAGGRG